MIEVERQKALRRRLSEFLARDAAIEVGVGGRHRFGKVEQAEARGALVAIIVRAVERSSATG